MMPTDLHQSLTEVRDAVPVPPVDLDRFEARVRHHRRRRHLTRSLVAAGAVAAVATTATVVPRLWDRDEPTTVATAVPAVGVPLVLDGRVQQLAADGTLRDTGLAGSPVGRLDGRLVVLDGHRLLGVGDAAVDDVVTAYVHPNGATYQTTDGLIEFVGVDGRNSARGPGTLLAATADAYVDDEGDGPLIHDSAGIHPVDLGSDGAAVDLDRAEAAGDTVVFVHDGGVEVYGTDGDRRYGFLGGETGALSGDGRTYAYAPDAEELAHDMLPGLSLYDTRSGDALRVALAEPAVQLRWYAGDVYVVTGSADGRSLWRCDRAACDRVLTDPGSTLALR